MSTCSCKVICSNSVCINPQHFTTPSTETITTLCHLHLLVKVDPPPPFIDNFYLEMDIFLDKEAFICVLACSPRLSFGNLSDMVYEF